LDHVLTPCIFKRGLIWILFFIVSFILAPFFSDEEDKPPTPPTQQVQTR